MSKYHYQQTFYISVNVLDRGRASDMRETTYRREGEEGEGGNEQTDGQGSRWWSRSQPHE